MTASVPDPVLADPMLRVLREHHPEVDVVLLPGPVPPGPEVPTLDTAQLSDLAAGADSHLSDLLGRLSRDPAWTGAERGGTWHTDAFGLVSFETVASVRDLAEGGNIALLRTTGAALVGLGWQARPVPGAGPQLVARRRGLTLAARVRAHELVVSVRTAPARRAPELQPTSEVGR